MSEPCEWKMGAHHARFEPPDTLWMKNQGPLSFEEFAWTVNLCRELGGQRTFILVVDVAEVTTMDPEGRRYASERMESEWFTAIIYVGARLIHRAAAKGIHLVQHLLGKKLAPLYFVASEEEARQLIAQLRTPEAPFGSEESV